MEMMKNSIVSNICKNASHHYSPYTSKYEKCQGKSHPNLHNIEKCKQSKINSVTTQTKMLLSESTQEIPL